jgi:hypothetical protein
LTLVQNKSQANPGTTGKRPAFFQANDGNKRYEANVSSGALEEAKMPVLLLWAVPAVIVVGGVGYYLVRAVN